VPEFGNLSTQLGTI